MKKWRYNPWVDSLATRFHMGFRGNGCGTGLCGYVTPEAVVGGGHGLSGYWEEVGKLGASDGCGVGLSGEMDGGGGVARISASMESLCQEFEDIE